MSDCGVGKVGAAMRKALALTGVVFLLATTGCADLAAIRKFASISSEASHKFDAIPHDLSMSCTRQYKYQQLRDIIKKTEFDPVQLAAIVETTNNADEQTTKECQIYRESEARLKRINKALVNYLEAIADLADDSVTSYDKELDALADSLNQENLLNDNQKTAFNNLGKFLYSAVAQGYRQSKLREAVTNTNQSVQVAIDGYKKVMNGYKFQLNNERDQMRSFFKTSLQDQKEQGKTNVIEGSMLVRDWQDAEMAIKNKLKGADDYLAVLTKIAEGHDKLKEQSNLGTKETATIIIGYARAIRSLVNDFKRVCY